MDKTWRKIHVWLIVGIVLTSFVGTVLLKDDNLYLKFACFALSVALMVALVYRVRVCSLDEGIMRGKESLPKPLPTQSFQVVDGVDMGFGKVKIVAHGDYNDFTRTLLTKRKGYIPRSIEIVKK